MTTKITFTLPAANIIGAEECVLLGEFNNWNLEKGFYLQKQADGSMTTEVELGAGRDYQYRYLLSNGRWVNDNGEKITSEMSPRKFLRFREVIKVLMVGKDSHHVFRRFQPRFEVF